MSNKQIKYFLLLLIAITAGIIVMDFLSKRPDRSQPNPWEYNVDEFRKVEDTALIMYNEILNIQLDDDTLRGISYSDEKIYIAGDNFIQVLSPEGKELARENLVSSPHCITVSDDKVFVSFKTSIAVFDLNCKLITGWDVPGKNSLITSLAVFNNLLFAADAHNRRVLRYKTNGEFLGQFEGKSETGQLHGFILPSRCFDLDISEDGELWIVNPGKHALELYSHEGRLKRYWSSPSFSPEGFSGCCNPVYIAILPDGSFVTSEKGIVRIKVHKPYGEIYGFVAPPEKFKDALFAPDIAVTPEGLIYALDFNSNRIRVFGRK